MKTWTDEDIATHDALIEELSDVLVSKMKTLPVDYIVNYCGNFERASGMLGLIDQYEDLAEAIWVMLHKLAELNGEAFTVELSTFYKDDVGSSNIYAMSLLKPFADQGGVVTDLLFNKYLRNVKGFGSYKIRDFQHFIKKWTEEGRFDADKLGSKHRPAYDRLMAIDVQALADAEQAKITARLEAKFAASPN